MPGLLPFLRLVAFGVLLCTAVAAERGHASASHIPAAATVAADTVVVAAVPGAASYAVQELDRASSDVGSENSDPTGQRGEHEREPSHGSNDPSEPTELGAEGADDFDSFEDVVFLPRLYVDVQAAAESREHAAIEDARVHARLEDRRCDRPPRA